MTKKKVNKSEIIRQLHMLGLTHTQISKVAKMRYNMVYNVIERLQARVEYKPPPLPCESIDDNKARSYWLSVLDQLGLEYNKKEDKYVAVEPPKVQDEETS